MTSNRIIVDANIIFSSLISRNSRIRDYLLRGDISYSSPEFVLDEIAKHKGKLIKCSQLSESEIDYYYHIILKHINFVRSNLISKSNIKFAYNLCKDIDEKDTIYVALALELNGRLWTGDKKLIDGLNKKNFKQVITTGQLFAS